MNLSNTTLTKKKKKQHRILQPIHIQNTWFSKTKWLTGCYRTAGDSWAWILKVLPLTCVG